MAFVSEWFHPKVPQRATVWQAGQSDSLTGEQWHSGTVEHSGQWDELAHQCNQLRHGEQQQELNLAHEKRFNNTNWGTFSFGHAPMHTYIRPHTHTHTHTCMTSPVNQKLKTLSTSAWTRCGFQVPGWMPMSASYSAATHVCVCVQVLLLLLFQANGMRCHIIRLRFVSVWRTKKNCREVKSKHRAAFDSQSGLSLCRSPASLCALHSVLCVSLATTFDLCSEADITWPGLKWDSRRIPELEPLLLRWRLAN